MNIRSRMYRGHLIQWDDVAGGYQIWHKGSRWLLNINSMTNAKAEIDKAITKARV